MIILSGFLRRENKLELGFLRVWLGVEIFLPVKLGTSDFALRLGPPPMPHPHTFPRWVGLAVRPGSMEADSAEPGSQPKW